MSRSASDASPSRLVAEPFTAAPGGVRVRLVVTPGARADRLGPLRVDGSGGVALRVGVTAPAENGRANAAVVALLARTWRLPKTTIRVVAGQADRRKTVEVAGPPGPLLDRLRAWAAASADED